MFRFFGWRHRSMTRSFYKCCRCGCGNSCNDRRCSLSFRGSSNGCNGWPWFRHGWYCWYCLLLWLMWLGHWWRCVSIMIRIVGWSNRRWCWGWGCSGGCLIRGCTAHGEWWVVKGNDRLTMLAMFQKLNYKGFGRIWTFWHKNLSWIRMNELDPESNICDVRCVASRDVGNDWCKNRSLGISKHKNWVRYRAAMKDDNRLPLLGMMYNSANETRKEMYRFNRCTTLQTKWWSEKLFFVNQFSIESWNCVIIVWQFQDAMMPQLLCRVWLWCWSCLLWRLECLCLCYCILSVVVKSLKSIPWSLRVGLCVSVCSVYCGSAQKWNAHSSKYCKLAITWMIQRNEVMATRIRTFCCWPLMMYLDTDMYMQVKWRRKERVCDASWTKAPFRSLSC